MFNLLNPFKFVILFSAIIMLCIGCFGAVYVLLVGAVAYTLPYGRDVALLWLTGELPSRIICIEDGELWPLFDNPYYAVVSQGSNMVPWLTPLSGYFPITAGFMDPAYEQEFGAVHHGIDLSCPVGTPVYATLGGRVYVASDNGMPDAGLGLRIGIDNDSFATEYGHLSLSLVKVGDVVTPGALIGYTGNTGKSTGPHLHYAVMYDWDWVDPAQFWNGAISTVRTATGATVSLPSEALGGQLPAYESPSPTGGTGGAMGQYFPAAPPPVPSDWAHRGIPYISGEQSRSYAVLYARRLSDAENHGNLRLYGRVLGSDGQGLGGVTVRCFSDAGWESRLTTNP
ncbi:MAG: M23 family metallopeptidase, partial [Chloroflexi bacterium]|nr:M23 family metallopeptidase [Chloroflexota bacterium]